jgi:hypothetical protein
MCFRASRPQVGVCATIQAIGPAPSLTGGFGPTRRRRMAFLIADAKVSIHFESPRRNKEMEIKKPS